MVLCMFGKIIRSNTTSSYRTYHLVSLDWAKPTARRDEKHLSLGYGPVYTRGFTVYNKNVIADWYDDMPMEFGSCKISFDKYSQHIETWTKRPTFCRRQFRMHFVVRRFFISFLFTFHWNFTFARCRTGDRPSDTWNNDKPVHWCRWF